MSKVAILQPFVPHYREEFFHAINNNMEIDLYVYQSLVDMPEVKMQQAGTVVKLVKAFSVGPVLFYNILPFLKSECEVLVLMGTVTHLSTWILLILKKRFRKKIILWGHGISIKRYAKQEKKVSRLYKLMYRLADFAWFYTEKEQQIWANELPKLESVSLNNTISDVGRILSVDSKGKRENLEFKHGVTTKINLIFCARFSSLHRRVDVLEYIIKNLDATKYGFIIIGDGKFKPDFSEYSNVYDFGVVYDEKLKDELFTIADIYIQPAWLGLSVVEAMAYGKPVFTLERSQYVLQGVEYDYIVSGENGYIADNAERLLNKINAVGLDELEVLGGHAKEYVRQNLAVERMAEGATISLKQLCN